MPRFSNSEFKLLYPITGLFVFVASMIQIGEQELNKRDAIAITETDSIQFTATSNASLLVIEVPMQW